MLVSPFDVPAVALIGFVGAFVYARFLKPRNPDWYPFIGVGTVGLFWIHAVLAVAGVSPLGVDVDNSLIGVAYILSYPMWFRWASERAFVLFGRGPEQGGIAWVLRVRDTTEGFEPDWEKE